MNSQHLMTGTLTSVSVINQVMASFVVEMENVFDLNLP
jgi:hypothetical protein